MRNNRQTSLEAYPAILKGEYYVIASRLGERGVKCINPSVTWIAFYDWYFVLCTRVGTHNLK